MKKPIIQVLQPEKNFGIPTYPESPTVREHFRVIKGQSPSPKADIYYSQAYGSLYYEIMRCGKPVILHMGGSPWLELKGAKLQRVEDMCRKAKRVVCNSRFLLDVFERNLGTPNLCTLRDGLWGMDHTPLGPMPSRFDPPKSDYSAGDEFTVIMSFNLKDDGYKHNKWSGIPVLLEAVEKVVRGRGVKFMCAGRGSRNFDYLEEWSKFGFEFSPSHHIDDSADRWPGILRDADLFVHPSLFDCWPRAVGDAMCAGLPGMVFDATGNAEVSDTYQAMDPTDARAVAELFGAFVEDEGLREMVGKAARFEAEERSRAGRKAYLKIFLEVLGRRRP